MGWSPAHKRVKPKYNPTPTAREKAFHEWLIENFNCACGCGAVAGVVHHPLTRHPEQRWRRDHEFVVPMHGFCHTRLHHHGDEATWKAGLNLADKAFDYRRMGYETGVL